MILKQLSAENTNAKRIGQVLFQFKKFFKKEKKYNHHGNDHYLGP